MIIIVMGVSGCGKTTFAEALHEKLGWSLVEADDHHSIENKAKMEQGIPLTDKDRYPWLQSLANVISGWHQTGKNGILTCSALKRIYRDILLTGRLDQIKSDSGGLANVDPHLKMVKPDTGAIQTSPCQIDRVEPSARDVVFVHLHGPQAVISQRLGQRSGHFMPASLLRSQYNTLEHPDPKTECVIELSVENSLVHNVEILCETLKLQIVS